MIAQPHIYVTNLFRGDGENLSAISGYVSRRCRVRIQKNGYNTRIRDNIHLLLEKAGIPNFIRESSVFGKNGKIGAVNGGTCHLTLNLLPYVDVHFERDDYEILASGPEWAREIIEDNFDTVVRMIRKINKICYKNTKIKPPKTQTAHINLIVPSLAGLSSVRKELKMPCEKEKLLSSYMPDTVDFYNKTCSVIATQSKGMILMYGPPGTGKTTMIRQLAQDSERRFMFIPSSMIDSLGDPKLIAFLLQDGRDCVLVIEDAETALRERDKAFSQSAASNLLQLADGILSDVLGVTVIATFNTSLDNIDPAFLRAGRCLAKHEFPLIQGEKLKSLAPNAEKPMSIAEIVNP